MIVDIKPCPFCGSNDIKYSMKVSGHFDRYYHCQYYCNKCHTYGPRANTKAIDNMDYAGRAAIENDEVAKAKALELWNKRINEVEDEQ